MSQVLQTSSSGTTTISVINGAKYILSFNGCMSAPTVKLIEGASSVIDLTNNTTITSYPVGPLTRMTTYSYLITTNSTSLNVNFNVTAYYNLLLLS